MTSGSAWRTSSRTSSRPGRQRPPRRRYQSTARRRHGGGEGGSGGRNTEWSTRPRARASRVADGSGVGLGVVVGGYGKGVREWNGRTNALGTPRTAGGGGWGGGVRRRGARVKRAARSRGCGAHLHVNQPGGDHKISHLIHLPDREVAEDVALTFAAEGDARGRACRRALVGAVGGQG